MKKAEFHWKTCTCDTLCGKSNPLGSDTPNLCFLVSSSSGLTPQEIGWVLHSNAFPYARRAWDYGVRLCSPSSTALSPEHSQHSKLTKIHLSTLLQSGILHILCYSSKATGAFFIQNLPPGNYTSWQNLACKHNKNINERQDSMVQWISIKRLKTEILKATPYPTITTSTRPKGSRRLQLPEAPHCRGEKLNFYPQLPNSSHRNSSCSQTHSGGVCAHPPHRK